LSIEAKAVTVAVIGGTGKEGSGLAFRWANAGYNVIIGSRTMDKAEQAASELNAQLSGVTVQGMPNEQAAQQADWVVLTVPYSAHKSTLESIKAQVQGKVLIDVTVPIVPPNFMTPTLPAGRTAAEEAQALLGTGVKVVSAFQNVSAVHLKNLSHSANCDVLVASDDADAKQAAIALAEAARMRGVDVGPLANAIVAEALTPVLLGINKRYGVKGAGIKITELG
jgi:8-hydroxy-5-deazaflavin:NADPH oxidoreductase